MKSRWIIALVSIIIVCLSGLLIYISLRTKSFTAKISHVGEGYLIVEVSNNEKYNGRYSLTINDTTQIVDDLGNAILLSDLSEGDIIRVFYIGGIEESDPALISECRKVSLVTSS